MMMKLALGVLIVIILSAQQLVEARQESHNLKGAEPTKRDGVGCHVDGKTYAVGSHFVPDSCMGECTCSASNRYSCVPLCPSSLIECTPFTQEISVRKPNALNNKCYCEDKKCIPVLCKVGDRFYAPGDSFVNPDCSGKCYCTGPGYHCLSLCPPSRCSPGLTPVMEKTLVSSQPECYCNNIVDCVEKDDSLASNNSE